MATSDSGLIGARLRRTEDPRLMCGQGFYAGDIERHDMLFAAFVRSPVAHARVKNIDGAAAMKVHGVHAVLTASDVPLLGRSLPLLVEATDLQLRSPSPLAAGRVHFQGEAVAMILASDPYAAADAVASVAVEWESLPAVVDPEKAWSRDGPRVHEDMPDNRVGTVRTGFGDAEAGLTASHHVVSRRFAVERSACGALEARVCMAEPVGPNSTEGLTLHTSTQAPHNHRAALSRLLELPVECIRVSAPDVGGGFGPKGRLYPEEVAVSVAAMHFGQPVAWWGDRSEDLATTYQGRGVIVDATLAADTSGRLVALKAKLLQDCGAYLASGLLVPSNSAQHMLGPYRIPAVAIEIAGAYTNKTPLTPLRGGGREIGAFVIERMIDHLAREMKLDPMELRRRNALGPDEFPYDTGYPARGGGTLVYDSGDFPAYLNQAAELLGEQEKTAADRSSPERLRRGSAVTLFIESTGFAGETARARLKADGTVDLRVGSPSTGQGHATAMSQVFASRLGIPIEDIHYSSGDTVAVDQGVGTFGSRIAVTAGNASARAGDELRQRILEAAENLLEASHRDLELVDGVIRVRGYPARSITLRDLAHSLAERRDSPLEVETSWTADGRPGAFAGGAHAAAVVVDVETGHVDVERYVVVHDCGTVINPTIVDGQIHGGVIHGVGNALSERMAYEDASGQLLTGTFASYQLPGTDAATSIEIVHHSVPSPNNPEGIKGAGEGGTIGALATIAAAVENALTEFGIEINHLPIEPEWLASQL